MGLFQLMCIARNVCFWDRPIYGYPCMGIYKYIRPTHVTHDQYDQSIVRNVSFDRIDRVSHV